MRKTARKRREGRRIEGGPMVDCGTHQIDLVKRFEGMDAEWARTLRTGSSDVSGQSRVKKSRIQEIWVYEYV